MAWILLDRICRVDKVGFIGFLIWRRHLLDFFGAKHVGVYTKKTLKKKPPTPRISCFFPETRDFVGCDDAISTSLLARYPPYAGVFSTNQQEPCGSLLNLKLRRSSQDANVSSISEILGAFCDLSMPFEVHWMVSAMGYGRLASGYLT